jgi:hypothetical protein
MGVAPPLDADFFAQAQRMPLSQQSRADRDLFSFIRSEFGQGDLPTLEVFFTQVSAIDRFHRDFNIRGRPSGRFSRHLGALRKLVPRVFDEALGGLTCTWHQRIVSAMRSGDALVSFNYDTLIDHALREVGGNRWNPSVGYGFNIGSVADSWIPAPHPGPTVLNPILLLKPHGSLNWMINDSTRDVHLVEEYSETTVGSIVPPTWDKLDVRDKPWSDVWRAARVVLGRARLVIVIGYSVPVTDQLSQALLRADLTKVDALVVVNPDRDSRKRMVGLMASALDLNAVVIELSTLEEFASYLPTSKLEVPVLDPGAVASDLSKQLNRLGARLAAIHQAQSSVERDQENIRDDIHEMIQRVEAIEDSEVEDEIERLQSEISNLDSRIDSLTI